MTVMVPGIQGGPFQHSGDRRGSLQVQGQPRLHGKILSQRKQKVGMLKQSKP